MKEEKADFDEKYKIVETRYCEWFWNEEKSKNEIEEDCTHCKYCILGEYQMCSDGNERRFSKCMVKGEPYTIHLDYGRCDYFEKQCDNNHDCEHCDWTECPLEVEKETEGAK